MVIRFTRTKMINGKRYYYLGTYFKKPSAAAIQRTGASVYERRLFKSFKLKDQTENRTYYLVYYRDVKAPAKYRDWKKRGRYAYSNKKNNEYNKLYGNRKLFGGF